MLSTKAKCVQVDFVRPAEGGTKTCTSFWFMGSSTCDASAYELLVAAAARGGAHIISRHL